MTVPPHAGTEKDANTPIPISPALARSSFASVSPAPYQAHFAFGVSHVNSLGQEVISAHPDCDLWLHPPETATTILWNFGILPGAYE